MPSGAPMVQLHHSLGQHPRSLRQEQSRAESPHHNEDLLYYEV